jgi:hypothetical protein
MAKVRLLPERSDPGFAVTGQRVGGGALVFGQPDRGDPMLNFRLDGRPDSAPLLCGRHDLR